MKNLHFTILVGIFSAMIITKNVEAQQNDLAAQTKISEKNRSDNFKPSIFIKSHVIEKKFVNERALKDFNKHYETSSEKWIESAEGVTAKFNKDDIHYAIYYNKKGNWTGSLKTYPENLMDKDIRTMVKREYFDFQIMGVQEIKYVGHRLPTYIVILQNKNHSKWIRINDWTMDVYKEF